MYRLRFKSYSLPFRQALRTAHGLWSEREGLLVRLETAEGGVGFGEAAPVPGFGGASLAEMDATLRRLGRESGEEELDHVIGQGGALGFALAAARAEAEGRAVVGEGPMHEYLPVAALLPAGRAAIRVAVERAELGFRTFKWKVGVGDPRDERVMLDDLLGELPSESRLRLDANGAWDRRQAEAWLECCAERPMIEFVEQPVAAGGAKAEDLLLGLAGDYPTPLALDESLVGEADLQRWLELGWPGVWVLKAALMGDPARLAKRIAQHRLDVVISTALETAVGARSVYALAFALERHEARRALGMGVWPLFGARWANGPTAMPFVRWTDVTALNAEAVWNGVNS
ncbi:o-succinylbenzoate synthase [Actomonas aquatica]|uniref:o-succinylbenzoate synthase n=1 Tax=Actomonas aquatica TaxID=2866162 RepID=A0ABZ1CAQ0_9BACT|nr:o-succinylbenzoate synthase [Opitutus sp. WL0086]WRQ88611.1 o-succinylbenzoate synthase [Opitutus sp. WL0086]